MVQRYIVAGSGERGLAAIMFTDIVGYTRLTQSNESLALEMLEEHRSLLRPSFLAHGGTEIKTIGDAFLVEFKSALEAVLCAVELQKNLSRRNEGVVPARRMELRIGIHVGDVVHGGSDIQGDAVNVASRIEPLAEPGGICITQQVVDQVRNKTSLDIEEIGEVDLKNVELPVRVYRVGSSAASGPSKPRELGPRERLAVLPFVNISPDPNDEYFADGLTEELITKLSEIGGLKVIARTSVIGYKRKEKKVSEIAKELGVGSVIEGSVRKSGSKIRISVQLVDSRTEERLWSSSYDSELDDIFAIQRDVASKVATALSATFFPEAPRKDTHDIEAYTLYLKAKQLSYGMTEKNIRETIALLKRAISKDPSFARAYAALAHALGMLAVAGYEDFAAMAKEAESSAKRALELDPGLAEAHSAMAATHAMLDRFDDSRSEAEAAVRINPNLSEAHAELGILDCITRTTSDALIRFKRAYELDPLSPGAAGIAAAAAWRTGDDEFALGVLERMREFYPKDPLVILGFADYYMEKKEFDEAQRMMEAARALGPNEPLIGHAQALLDARIGRTKEAEEELKEIREEATESFRLNGELWVTAALGRMDEAFATLMRMAEKHSWPYDIRLDPLYEEMRKDSRYLEFCRKVGIKP